MLTKKILPLAFITATASTCVAFNAHAQSNVTAYGRVNVAVVNYSGYGSGRPALTTQNNLSSRLGFKGLEDLGGGLAATFVIETGFSADTGAGTIGSRETTVGLQGALGRVRLGFMLTPLDDFHGVAGPGWVTNVTNDNLNGFWGNGYSNLNASEGKRCDGTIPGTDAGNNFSFDNRYGNSIRYDSPVFNDFTFATHVALGESSASGCNNSLAWSSKLQYVANGLNAGIAYNLHRNARGPGLHDNITLLTAGYKINPSSYIAGYYQTLKYDNPGKQNLKQDGFGLTGRLYQGPHFVELGWYHGSAGKGDQTPVFSGIFVGGGTQANLYILGYRYALSKRTDLWAQFAQLRNGNNSGYDLGGAGRAGAAGTIGQSPRAIALGIRHDF